MNNQQQQRNQLKAELRRIRDEWTAYNDMDENPNDPKSMEYAKKFDEVNTQIWNIIHGT